MSLPQRRLAEPEPRGAQRPATDECAFLLDAASALALLDGNPMLGLAWVREAKVVWRNRLLSSWLDEAAEAHRWLLEFTLSTLPADAAAHSWLLPIESGEGAAHAEAVEPVEAAAAAAPRMRWLEGRVQPYDDGHLVWVTDVSERESLRGRLVEAVSERDAILHNALLGLVLLKGRSVLAWVNPAFEQSMLGYAPGELVGLHVGQVFASREGYREALAFTTKALLDNPSLTREFELRRKDGSTLWVQATGKAVDPKDPARGIVWGLLDITERRALLERLDAAVQEREAIVQTSMVGIAIFNPDDTIRWVNGTMERMFGYAPGELIGKPARLGYDSEQEYRRERDPAMAVLKSGRQIERTVVLTRKDGSRFDCHVAGKLVDPADPAKGVLWFLRDVTESRKLERVLERTRAERETILRVAQVGICVAVYQHFRWTNDAFAQMLGYEAHELVGKSSRAHFTDTAAWYRMGTLAHQAFGRGEAYECEMTMRRRDGSTLVARINARALNAEALDEGVVWTYVDITALKQAQQQMQQALERERELSDLKTRFVAMTSHEFRTPLSAISSATELLQFYGERLGPSEREEIFGDIHAALRRMNGMMEDILTMGRIEAGLFDFHPQPADVQALAESVVAELRAIDRGRHALRLRWSGARAASVDAKLLRHALTNLVANGLKYTPAGGSVEVAGSIDAEGLCLRVSDTGLGIPAADLPRLFERFHRGSNVAHIKGTGLGLAIAHEAAKLHGGRITVSSKLGQGSEFVLMLPPSPAGESG
jgi:PAS domain S-box-containing protein